jgi:hypothetical protein
MFADNKQTLADTQDSNAKLAELRETVCRGAWGAPRGCPAVETWRANCDCAIVDARHANRCRRC